MSDKITLDRETFKVLAADTRIEMLKRLERHKETLTDIADGMNMSPSTIKEHLDRMASAGLVEIEDKGTKWKYYRLTRKGSEILNPYETKVWILLGTTVLLLFGAVYGLLGKLTPTDKPEPVLAARQANEMAPILAKGVEQGANVPYPELAAVVVLALAAGACVGYLVRNKIMHDGNDS